MSWDLIIQDFGSYRRVSDIPHGFQPKPLGPKSALISRISEIAPTADFGDPAWGLIECGNGSIEINMGDEDPCESIMLHVRGGDDAFDTVATLLRELGLRAIDAQTSEFFDESDARQSFATWTAYRDKVVAQYDAPKPSLIQRLLGIFK